MTNSTKDILDLKRKVKLSDIFIELEGALEELIEFEKSNNNTNTYSEKRRRGFLGFLLNKNEDYLKNRIKINKSIENKLNLIVEITLSDNYLNEFNLLNNLIKTKVYSGSEIKDRNGNDSNLLLIINALGKIAKDDCKENELIKTLIECRTIFVSTINELRNLKISSEIMDSLNNIINVELERRIILNDIELYRNRSILDTF